MNCVQCGDELPASAKFCKKCGCKAQPSDAGKPASRGLPPAPTPAYTTCPDCGALCKHDARFCNKCGCRFEEAPSFENTKRDLNTPLTKDEEKAILVFGNVQDSTSPAPAHNGERIDTSPAMVIGGAAALASSPAAVPAPGLRPADTADAQPEATPPQPFDASNTPAVQPAARAAAANAAPAAAENTPKPAQRNPMPAPVPQASGSGKWIALGVLALAALIGGGAWWWNTQGKNRMATTAPAPAPAAPVAPVAPASAPAVVAPPPAVSAESALTPNETIEPTPVESAPVAPVVAAPPAVAPSQQEAPAPRPAPRKPVRKQTLDDLLS